MKTQILQLESYDDVISARDKMGWGQTARILLVWPVRGQILTRRLDLMLLQRRSRELGSQLALVTRDPLVRYHARSLGVPVFESARLAQQSHWRRQRHQRLAQGREERNRRSSPSPTPRLPFSPSPLLRLILFTIGVLAVLSIAAALFPSATITATPATQSQQVIIAVQASATAERVNPSGLVPLRTVSVTVEGHDSLVPTGVAQVAETSAHGQATFTNLTNQSLSIPVGTVVSTRDSLILFAADRGGTIQAGVGQALTLPVTALTAGNAGNLPAERIQTIQGPLSASLTVTNPEPTTGGRDRSSPAATPLDRGRLRNRLLLDLQAEALSEIEDILDLHDVLLTSNPTLVRILEESYDPADSRPTSLLSLSLRVEYQAQVVSGADLRALAAAVLDANLPQGYIPLPETLVIENATTPSASNGSDIHWQLRAQRAIRVQLSKPEVINLSLGQTPSQARERLVANLPLTGMPRIHLNPSWWPRLPILPFRITVNTE